MTKTRSMTSQKLSAPSSSFEVDILSLSFDSFTGSMESPSISSKKRVSSSKQKASKKPRPLASGSLSPSDMQRFWGLEQKHMYDNFKSRPIVPGRVVNLSQLKDSHCPKNDELKTRLLGVERGFETLHDVVEKVFHIQKDTTTDIEKLRSAMTGIKQEGISTVNKLIRQVDSLKGGVNSSNNDLAVSVQTSYSNLSRGVERSYNTFCEKVINTLKYFWGEH